jgi:inner membrane protein
VGLLLARSGLKRFTPCASAIAVVAANAPDFDALCWFGGPLSYIRWHRNFTHSLFALPIMALLSAGLVRAFGRRQIRWLPAWLIAMMGVASHLILDLTNVYGVRLLLPFSGRWFHWDFTPVVDLSIWAILLIGIAIPALSRLVEAEIGGRRQSSGAGWAMAALLMFAAYDFGRGVFHSRAVAFMEARIYDGNPPIRTGAFPEANPLRWTGIAETRDAYIESVVDLRESFRAQSGHTWYKAQQTSALLAAMSTQPFQRFLEFVQYPIWVIEPSVDAERTSIVRLVDFRFGTPAAPGFQAVATVNDANQILNSAFTFGFPKVR